VRVYTHEEVIELIKKAYEDAADSLRPWVYGGPHVDIERRKEIAITKLEKKYVSKNTVQ
jgi:hypothetical protein